MGVPSFYRWLVNKYPKIVARAVGEIGDDIDTSLPNPNGMEFDCLYLDMNGIIHPCFHPEDSILQPTSFEDVFKSIEDYIDRLFSIVRPRKLLYLAVDGVAPRAKMNQQRSRRFRTAKDNEIAEAEEERLRLEFEKEGKGVLPKLESEVSDSNVITPGTEFMYKLSKALQKYICARIELNSGWKHIKVILSDANVPGEGEHKIMNFIRQQRNNPNYNPNTRHCLYGLDADLIMLSLASHELHFSILREDVLIQEQQSRSEPGLATSLNPAEPSKARGWFRNVNVSLIKKPYQFIHVWILREYLELDMKINDPPEKFQVDTERIVDDFIFICFFTGNDFLPHMPTLNIHEGALDLLMTVYKKEFKSLGGYLVDMKRVHDKKMGYVKLKRVEKFILMVGSYEEKIFKKRSELHERKLKWVLHDHADQEGDLTSSDQDLGTTLQASPSNGTQNSAADHFEILKNTMILKEKLKDCLRAKSDLFNSGRLGTDKVRLGCAGWKERYYKEKFSADKPEEIEIKRKQIVQKYTEGLLWVLQYYFSGVPSWTWFYPFHYGPFASDLKGLSHVKVKFEKGLPYKPFDQLMGVLPPRSAHALPKPYQKLMTDDQSEIIDFYPTDFQIDTDGKRFIWQGICKLSFIEEKRLLAETTKLEEELGEEAVRNANIDSQLFVRSSSKLGSQILKLNGKQAPETIDTNLSDEISGFMHPCCKDADIVDSTSAKEIQKDTVLCVFYEHPNCGPHIPRLLAGLNYPDKTVFEANIMETPLWHEYHGSRPPITRLSDRDWNKSKDTGVKFTSTNSCEFIHTKAGSGWLGRGKGLASTSELGGNFPESTKFQIGNVRRGTSSSLSDQGIRGGMYSTSISESSSSIRFHSRARPMNNSFQPSRTGSSYNRNDEFYNAPPSSQGRGRGGHQGSVDTMSHAWQNGSLLAANSSMQPANWRSQYVHRDPGTVWRPRASSESSGTERNSRW